jgi:hypothetical protein
VRVLALQIEGFRGIRKAVVFRQHAALVGRNGSGKSAILDPLSLTFGRTQLVRELTEHDFCGSTPAEATRFRLVATVTGVPCKPRLHLRLVVEEEWLPIRDSNLPVRNPPETGHVVSGLPPPEHEQPPVSYVEREAAWARCRYERHRVRPPPAPRAAKSSARFQRGKGGGVLFLQDIKFRSRVDPVAKDPPQKRRPPSSS